MTPDGEFVINESKVISDSTFLRYLYGGLQIKTHVALDFSK